MKLIATCSCVKGINLNHSSSFVSSKFQTADRFDDIISSSKSAIFGGRGGGSSSLDSTREVNDDKDNKFMDDII